MQFVFVNGRPLAGGAVPFEMLAEMIEDELQRDPRAPGPRRIGRDGAVADQVPWIGGPCGTSGRCTRRTFGVHAEQSPSNCLPALDYFPDGRDYFADGRPTHTVGAQPTLLATTAGRMQTLSPSMHAVPTV